ncbi:MAG: hypothetical protein M3R45_05480 [Pseudomonadota bacterium]|nr:hypothetical protein [Pseudomonadota bacterium]
MKTLFRRAIVALGWLAALWMGAAGAGEVQNTPIRYRVADGAGKTFEASFPYLRLADPLASARVNALLHHLALQTLAPAAAPVPGAAPLDLSAREATAGLNSIKAQDIDLLNGARVLRVPLVREGCGAYCASGTETLAFDARSGRLLALPELVTPAGLTSLARQAAQAHQATLKRTLAQLEKSLGAAKPGSQAETVAQARIDMYERCLQERFSSGGTLASLYLDEPGSFFIREGGLSFEQGPCSVHANQALDELGALVYAPSAETLRPHLTAYGRALVLGEEGSEGGQPPAPLNPYAQLFKGKINGRLPVTLFLGASRAVTPGQMKPFSEALYYYDKYRQPIALTVVRQGDSFILTESAPAGAPAAQQAPAQLVFRLEGRVLKGQWRSAGKTYAFEAMAL